MFRHVCAEPNQMGGAHVRRQRQAAGSTPNSYTPLSSKPFALPSNTGNTLLHPQKFCNVPAFARHSALAGDVTGDAPLGPGTVSRRMNPGTPRPK